MSDQNGHQAETGSVLWAWVVDAETETGVARLKTAWIPLGTINLGRRRCRCRTCLIGWTPWSELCRRR